MMYAKRLTALAAVSAIISASSGCATQTERLFVQEPLPLPDRPTLPRIAADDLQCLADEAYTALVERDARQGAHIERLERIILTTH